METVKLGIGRIKILQALKHDFNDEIQNNVSLICGDGVMVKGNSLLLASISPWLYKLFKEHSHEEITILTPDIQSENVAHLMRTVQANLTSNTSIECIINENTFKTLFKPNSVIKLPFCKVDIIDIKCEKEETDSKEDTNITKDLVDNSTTYADDTHYEDDDIIVGQPNDFLETDIETKMFPNSPQISYNSLADTAIIPMDKVEKAMTITIKNGAHTKKRGKGRPKKNSKVNDTQPRKKGRPKKDPAAPPIQRMTREEYLNSFPLSKLCPFCGQEFANATGLEKSEYARHVRKHKLDQFSCECQETWESKAEKERHMKVKHLGYSQCPQCYECFRKANSLVLHTEQKHSESAKNSKSGEQTVCHQCGKGFQSKESLHIHMQYVHNKEISNCNECGKDFEGPYRLKDHQRRVHRPKPCPICGNIFQNIRLHMHTVHREEKDKRHVCDICGKGFIDKGKLRCHNMSVHIKARPFNCRYGCSFSYNDLSNRNSHEKKKHGGLFPDENCTLSI